MPKKLGVALLVLLSAAAARADVVIDWNKVALNAIRVDKTPPPKASRALACVHVAMFDAINTAGYFPYAPYLVEPIIFILPVSPEAAGVSAAYETLIELFPAQKATFDAARAASLAAIPDGIEKVGGIEWGAGVAQAILDLRHDDGADKTVDYEAPLGGNWWAPTPPAFAAALLPNWPYVTPWAMTKPTQFRQGSPPISTSPEYLKAFREVERLGRADSQVRTTEQTQIALFWADGPGTATPPGHWHVIAQGLSQEHGLSLIENARLFALLALTGADAAIVSWDHKYAFSNWRPVTGIQHADIDGNPDTTADTRWSPLIATPPFPSYTSGHSTFSGGSARLLGLFFGTDQVSFSTTSDGLPGVTRSFTSLSQAAEEAGQSRIYGGIHWQFDNQVGLASGRALAEHVFFNFLTPFGVGTCTPGPTTLCLAGGRFKVEAAWKTATSSGTGNAEAQGNDSGRFWFFNEDNTEIVVKVLNACSGFDRYWVFASGLTNVEVLITVTDTQSVRRIRQYFNPQGKPFAPVQDTDAFATCP